jgi:serine/threonine-protein kinase RsbW
VTADLVVDLPRSNRAPLLARKLLDDRFGGDLPAQQLDDLLVIVSELASNAVLHGSGEIRLRVTVDDGCVYGEVIDEGGGFVTDVRRRGIDEVGKKGLVIVAALSARWGIHAGSSHVWFELSPRDERDIVDPGLGTAERPPQLD